MDRPTATTGRCVGPDTVVDLVEGRLDGGARAAIESHIDACSDCRRYVSEVLRVGLGEGSRVKVDSVRSWWKVFETNRAAPFGTSALASGTVLSDSYEILRQVGTGGMGQVYEAKHLRLPGRVAVKVLRPEAGSDGEAFARFQREAQVASALRHPNIVQVVDFNRTSGGEPYIVMEFLEGMDLAARLRSKGAIPIERTLTLADQMASALAAAHRHGVVHRDLKPQNVFLVPVPGQDREFAKLVDFGISKVRAATRQLTRDSAIIGTPRYMSPEQALGRGGEVDARTDQFALGAIVYEMLAGRPAFDGADIPSVMHNVVSAEPPPLPAVKGTNMPALEAVLARALSKNPSHRFSSVLDFVKALRRAAYAPPSSGISSTIHLVRRRTPRALVWAAAAAGALGGVALGIAAVEALTSDSLPPHHAPPAPPAVARPGAAPATPPPTPIEPAVSAPSPTPEPSPSSRSRARRRGVETETLSPPALEGKSRAPEGKSRPRESFVDEP